MQNIQDLKEKIFFESKNIIGILDKISNVDELLSKQDLVDELGNRISFLRLLEKNIEYFSARNPAEDSVNSSFLSSDMPQFEFNDENREVTEEEAIFNNELNEIGGYEAGSQSHKNEDEEAEFNHQLNEIVENELHETVVHLAEEHSPERNADIGETLSQHLVTEEEAIFNNQLNEIDETEPSSPYSGQILNFVDEEKILADAEPDDDEGIEEKMFSDEVTEEEAVFNNQLNEIDEFENQISDDDGNINHFEEEEKIQDTFQSMAQSEDKEYATSEPVAGTFDNEPIEDEEILIEEAEEEYMAFPGTAEQGGPVSETSNTEDLLTDIKNENSQEDLVNPETSERRKITEIDRPYIEKEIHPSDENFEDLDQYNHEKKIKLANIKGLKSIHSLFDSDPLDKDFPEHKTTGVPEKEETGSILKTNIPTHFMEAEKAKPAFRLDLNDRIAFTKTLFGGSQADMNDVIGNLNSFRTLEEAKEYLSDLYYERKWSGVDEYAQRLWILVENKFL